MIILAGDNIILVTDPASRTPISYTTKYGSVANTVWGHVQYACGHIPVDLDGGLCNVKPFTSNAVFVGIRVLAERVIAIYNDGDLYFTRPAPTLGILNPNPMATAVSKMLAACLMEGASVAELMRIAVFSELNVSCFSISEIREKRLVTLEAYTDLGPNAAIVKL